VQSPDALGSAAVWKKQIKQISEKVKFEKDFD
jgi:hypothetical protein